MEEAGSEGHRGDLLHQWLVYFDRNSPLELVEEVKKMNGAIQMADERMVYVTGDAEAIRTYEMRQMAIYDIQSMQMVDLMMFLNNNRVIFYARY